MLQLYFLVCTTASHRMIFAFEYDLNCMCFNKYYSCWLNEGSNSWITQITLQWKYLVCCRYLVYHVNDKFFNHYGTLMHTEPVGSLLRYTSKYHTMDTIRNLRTHLFFELQYFSCAKACSPRTEVTCTWKESQP